MRLTATVMERSAWTILLGALSIFTTTHLKWTTRLQVDNAMFSVVRDGYEKNEIGDFRSILAQIEMGHCLGCSAIQEPNEFSRSSSMTMTVRQH